MFSDDRVVVFCQSNTERSGSPESARVLLGAWLRRGWRVTVITGNAGIYEDIYREMGCEVLRVTQTPWLRKTRLHRWIRDRLSGLFALIAIRRIIRKRRPSFVYINTTTSLEAALACRSSGRRLIWHVRETFIKDGGDVHPPLGLPHSLVSAVMMLLAHRVVTVSRAAATSILGKHAGRCHVVLNGLPHSMTNRQRVLDDGMETPGTIRVAIPGTIRALKGQDFAVRSLAAMDHIDAVSIIITGGLASAFARHVQELVEKFGLQERVSFVGEVADMAEVLLKSDIAIIPSSGDALPRTVMESMACGCAVVGTTVGGIPEMITDGKDGMLVDHGDVAKLAEILDSLVVDKQKREALGRAAQATSAVKFTEARYIAEIDRVIDSL